MDEKLKKTALRMFTYGTYVLTSSYNDEICAATVTWVSQASFDPPLISVCIKRESRSFSTVKQSKKLVLHLLSHEQKDYAAAFFKPSELVDGNINGHTFSINDYKMPILDEPPAYLECDVIEILENGDHPLFLVEVKNAVVRKEVNPLELRKTGWSYGG